ncbi:MAG TPA: protein kinase [Vicinamibacterales bacterium]|nr:protein kinase [Vicinamibacterales bacterium]
MMLEPGARLGSYEIVSRAGQGGAGIVYRARDLTLGREVAIKVLEDLPDRADWTAADLLREARHASSLSHPNICGIHHVGDVEGRHFIVMELIRGQTLAALIPPGGLPVERVLRYGAQLAAGVAHAHQHGIVHRDLKSGNVMVTEAGLVKILDFGLAWRLPVAGVEELTRSSEAVGETGTISGTLPYMPPELLAGRPATPASDVWSLGVVLYEMAAGRRPFHGETTLDLSVAIVKDAPAPLPAAVVAPLAAVISRCLAKDPGDRYQTAAEVEAALDVAASTVASGRASVAPEPSQGRGRLAAAWIRWALAGAVAAATIPLAVFLRGTFSDNPSVLRYQLVSTFPGAHRSGSLSPDGAFMAFVQEDATGVPQVWVKNLQSGDPVQITDGPTAAMRPRWAAARNLVVFARQGAGIWSVSPLGGPPRQIVPAGMNPHVAADGRTIVFEQDDTLWVVIDDGSGPRQVTGFPPRAYSLPYTPAISPDGRMVAFFRAQLGPNGDLWVVPAEGGEARRLTDDMCEGGSPAWTPDGRHIVFSSARTGSRTLWRVPVAGGAAEPITSGAGDDLEPDLTAAGDRLLYTNVRNSWRLHVRDLETGASRVIMDRREPVLWPRFSPDGSTLAFFGPSPAGPGHVFTVARDGGNLRQLTDRRGEINTMPRWSPDGRSLAFYQMMPARSLRQIPVAGGASQELAPLDWDRAPNAMFSPDGRFLVYFTRDRGGVTIVQDMESGSERALGLAIRNPRWSPVSSEIAGDSGGAIHVCPAEPAECRRITDGQHPVWSPDGSQLYFFRPGVSREYRELWSIHLPSRAERHVGRLGPMRVIDVTFDISSRGELVWAEFAPGRTELWMAVLQ